MNTEPTAEIVEQAISELVADNARLRAENAALREVLEDTPCECRTTYGGAIVLCMRCSALSPRDPTPASNPPEKPTDHATGHDSAGIEVGN